MLITLDHFSQCLLLFQPMVVHDVEKLVIYSATPIWKHLQNKYSNQDFMKLAKNALNMF